MADWEWPRWEDYSQPVEHDEPRAPSRRARLRHYGLSPAPRTGNAPADGEGAIPGRKDTDGCPASEQDTDEHALP